MENVTSKLIRELCNQALVFGKSRSFQISSDKEKYFRVLLSVFNSKSKIKIIARKSNSINWVVSAPINRINEDPRFKEGFDLIQELYSNHDKSITNDDYKLITKTISEVLNLCAHRIKKDWDGMIEKYHTNDSDLLK